MRIVKSVIGTIRAYQQRARDVRRQEVLRNFMLCAKAGYVMEYSRADRSMPFPVLSEWLIRKERYEDIILAEDVPHERKLAEERVAWLFGQVRSNSVSSQYGWVSEGLEALLQGNVKVVVVYRRTSTGKFTPTLLFRRPGFNGEGEIYVDDKAAA